MVWDEGRAKQWVANHDFSNLEVDVADLSREMDFPYAWDKGRAPSAGCASVRGCLELPSGRG
jgi:hypothetical protein